MTNKASTLYLPDAMANWPWPREINQYYEEVKAETDAWFHSFQAFSPQSQYAFDKCDFSLLAALVYPHASKEHLRTGCDLMMLFFTIDEHTDLQPESVVKALVDIVIDALKHPHKCRPEGEHVLGEITRQFWELAIKSARPATQRRMVDLLVSYLHSVVQQAADRDNNTYRSIAAYFDLRRHDSGAQPSLVPLELDLDLADNVIYHPTIVELFMYTADMIFINNDLLSYNKEQAAGDDLYNILTVAMRELNVDLAGAMDWTLKYHRDLEAKFMDGLKRVPSWGSEIDLQVQRYLDGLANWVRGNDCWHFECGRYFGNKGKEIQKTRLVQLLPKHSSAAGASSLRRQNIVVPLIEALEAK